MVVTLTPNNDTTANRDVDKILAIGSNYISC